MRLTGFINAIAAMALLGLPLSVTAEKTWHLVTDTEKSVAMTNVAQLVSADNSKEFSVVLKNGDIISNVKRATFEQIDPQGGVDVVSTGIKVFPTVVDHSLTVAGCAEGSVVRVLSMQGALLLSQEVDGGSTVVDVESLPAGCYLLQTENTVIRFIKR